MILYNVKLNVNGVTEIYETLSKTESIAIRRFKSMLTRSMTTIDLTSNDVSYEVIKQEVSTLILEGNPYYQYDHDNEDLLLDGIPLITALLKYGMDEPKKIRVTIEILDDTFEESTDNNPVDDIHSKLSISTDGVVSANKYKSERDLELLDTNECNFPMLTVENYMKWYSLYLVTYNGEVVKFPYDMTPDKFTEEECKLAHEIMSDGWKEHCIDPSSFIELCQKLNYTQNIFNKIYDMFVANYLCDEYKDLKDHIPKDIEYTGDYNTNWCSGLPDDYTNDETEPKSNKCTNWETCKYFHINSNKCIFGADYITNKTLCKSIIDPIFE